MGLPDIHVGAIRSLLAKAPGDSQKLHTVHGKDTLFSSRPYPHSHSETLPIVFSWEAFVANFEK